MLLRWVRLVTMETVAGPRYYWQLWHVADGIAWNDYHYKMIVALLVENGFICFIDMFCQPLNLKDFLTPSYNTVLSIDIYRTVHV